MKPHLDSRSNFNRYQHTLATVTVDRSFVKNGKSQDAKAMVLGEGRMGKKTCEVLVKTGRIEGLAGGAQEGQPVAIMPTGV